MREQYLKKIEDPRLQNLVSPLYNFFEPFISEGPLSENNDERKNVESSDLGGVEEEHKDEVNIKKDTTNQSKKSRKNIENKIPAEYLELRAQEMESRQILDNVNQLLSFSVSYNFRTLRSLTASLSTNINQFVKNEKGNMRTATKWRKVINSYISVTQIMLDIEEIENARNGNNSNKEVIISLGLVDYTDTQIKASVEIDKVIELSKQNGRFIVVPVFGCTTNVFFKILQEFGQSKILHVVGHGGITSERDYFIQFSDCNMRYRTFIRNLQNYGLNLDMVFLNCCYSFEFIEKTQPQYMREIISHTKEVEENVAIDFSDHYFTILLNPNNSYSVSYQGGDYTSNKPIYDKAWSIAYGNCSENPIKYKRL